MRFAVAVVVLGALTAPAVGQATIADFDRAMQSRLLMNRDDIRDFLPIQRYARAGQGKELDRALPEACARFLQRATADGDALAFAHIVCARLSDDAGVRIRHYETALALSDAARGKAHLALAAVVEDGARARRHIEAAIADNPDDPYPYLARARIQRDSNDLAAALRDVDRAIALAPGHPTDHVFRAELQRALGRFDAAAVDFVNAMGRAEPRFIKDVQGFLRTMGVDHGTSTTSFQEAIATCIRGTPCGAYLFQWAALMSRPACSIQGQC